LFHGARRVAADCEGQAPRRERAPLASSPDLVTLKRWLRRWTAVRHREAAERTLLTAIAACASPAALADLLLEAETDRTPMRTDAPATNLILSLTWAALSGAKVSYGPRARRRRAESDSHKLLKCINSSHAAAAHKMPLKKCQDESTFP
jgi:hypothetical protein